MPQPVAAHLGDGVPVGAILLPGRVMGLLLRDALHLLAERRPAQGVRRARLIVQRPRAPERPLQGRDLVSQLLSKTLH